MNFELRQRASLRRSEFNVRCSTFARNWWLRDWLMLMPRPNRNCPEKPSRIGSGKRGHQRLVSHERTQRTQRKTGAIYPKTSLCSLYCTRSESLILSKILWAPDRISTKGNKGNEAPTGRVWDFFVTFVCLVLHPFGCGSAALCSFVANTPFHSFAATKDWG